MITRSKYLDQLEDDLVKALSLDSRDKCIIQFARATGARATEILNLQPTDLYQDTSTVFIRGLKGSRDRELPVRPELMTALRQYVPFNIKYRRLEQIWRIHRPTNKKFHSLRHTFAISLYKRTKDLKLTQFALGHKSLTSTQIYLEFVYSQEEMKRILE